MSASVPGPHFAWQAGELAKTRPLSARQAGTSMQESPIHILESPSPALGRWRKGLPTIPFS